MVLRVCVCGGRGSPHPAPFQFAEAAPSACPRVGQEMGVGMGQQLYFSLLSSPPPGSLQQRSRAEEARGDQGVQGGWPWHRDGASLGSYSPSLGSVILRCWDTSLLVLLPVLHLALPVGSQAGEGGSV